MNYNAEPDLDLNSTDLSWGYTGEHDARAIGNKVMSTPEQAASDKEFGFIMPTENAISAAAYRGADKIPYAPSFDATAVHMEGEHISPATISEINKLENKLDKDHDLSGFYTSVRDMTEANLDNSYNRKLGA